MFLRRLAVPPAPLSPLPACPALGSLSTQTYHAGADTKSGARDMVCRFLHCVIFPPAIRFYSSPAAGMWTYGVTKTRKNAPSRLVFEILKESKERGVGAGAVRHTRSVVLAQKSTKRALSGGAGRRQREATGKCLKNHTS